ncbi:MAG: topoisomerase DNA-binding C4 zinc finger domain-containing protein, partial [Clostridia bacterium]|nr:topoisomerase DNA-binding C4 zinc finger domain-containing protein [Clostridia bacterium]
VVIDDINSIKNTILESNIKNLHSKKEHVSNIKNRIRQENKSVDNMVCPRCGAKLVQRQGRYGKFIGCSNYPKCRFTK